jgi:hypothetical protein
MLTDPLLIDHVDRQRLYEYEPLKGTIVRRQRTLLLTREAHDDLYQDPWERRPGELGREARERRIRKHALLARFIGGHALIPILDVKVLRPSTPAFQNVIEFRSGPPRPQSRLFALIYTPGVWVGAALHFRDDLGGLGDPRWETAAQAAQDAWAALFPERTPHPAPYPCDTRLRLKALLDA